MRQRPERRHVRELHGLHGRRRDVHVHDPAGRAHAHRDRYNAQGPLIVGGARPLQPSTPHLATSGGCTSSRRTPPQGEVYRPDSAPFPCRAARAAARAPAGRFGHVRFSGPDDRHVAHGRRVAHDAGDGLVPSRDDAVAAPGAASSELHTSSASPREPGARASRQAARGSRRDRRRAATAGLGDPVADRPSRSARAWSARRSTRPPAATGRRRRGRSGSSRSTRRYRFAWAAWPPSRRPTRSRARARAARSSTSTAAGATASCVPPLDLEDPVPADDRRRHASPANGQFALQMVYAVCSLPTRRSGARSAATSRGPPRRSTARPDASHRSALRLPPAQRRLFAARPGTSRFGYFRAGAEASWLHRDQGPHLHRALARRHRARDDARAPRRPALVVRRPTNPDVLAFHEGFADLVALFLHFSYPGSWSRPSAIRAAPWRGVAPLGHGPGIRLCAVARATARALRLAIDVEASSRSTPTCRPVRRRPLRYDPSSSRTTSAPCSCRRCSRRSSPWSGARASASSASPASTRGTWARRSSATSWSARWRRKPRRRGRVPRHLHPRHRLLPAGGHGARRVPAGAGHRGHRSRADDKWGYREALMRSFRRRHIFPDHVEFMTEDAVRWQPADGR